MQLFGCSNQIRRKEGEEKKRSSIPFIVFDVLVGIFVVVVALERCSSNITSGIVQILVKTWN